MRKPLFTGACTALVTPFLNGQINYPMMEQLLVRQINAGIQAVVLGGTTGEASTLSDDEKWMIIRRAKDYIGETGTIIAGTGSNCTEHAILLSHSAEKNGADALLVVSPYYNKATPEGLIRHFTAIANAVNIPVILYNIPSRTGVDIPVDVYQALSEIPNIVGVKEASSDITKIAEIRRVCSADFSIWSGNDSMTVPIISLGGQGVISVMSNICPVETNAMAMAALDGDFDTAAALHMDLHPLNKALFSEVNPIPVKAALKIIGLDCGSCRLPLTPASTQTIQNLTEILL